mmetsp:Transcript_8057/g.27567  ORF Transcript_8057/g.27567 Transcript_8057/m.27567 type:complete len:415 (-) Transcript_8057:1182-2426(-)
MLPRRRPRQRGPLGPGLRAVHLEGAGLPRRARARAPDVLRHLRRKLAPGGGRAHRGRMLLRRVHDVVRLGHERLPHLLQRARVVRVLGRGRVRPGRVRGLPRRAGLLRRQIRPHRRGQVRVLRGVQQPRVPRGLGRPPRRGLRRRRGLVRHVLRHVVLRGERADDVLLERRRPDRGRLRRARRRLGRGLPLALLRARRRAHGRPGRRRRGVLRARVGLRRRAPGRGRVPEPDPQRRLHRRAGLPVARDLVLAGLLLHGARRELGHVLLRLRAARLGVGRRRGFRRRALLLLRRRVGVLRRRHRDHVAERQGELRADGRRARVRERRRVQVLHLRQGLLDRDAHGLRGGRLVRRERSRRRGRVPGDRRAARRGRVRGRRRRARAARHLLPPGPLRDRGPVQRGRVQGLLRRGRGG